MHKSGVLFYRKVYLTYTELFPTHLSIQTAYNRYPPTAQDPHFPSCQSINHTVGYLHSEQNQEGNHQCEQASSFRKGETQNGISEQLSPQRRVSRDTVDQSAKHRSDTRSCANESCSCSSGSDQLACAEDGRADGDGLGDDAARLSACDVGGGVAEEGTAHQEAGGAGVRLESRD
jgi:hypothetical protein